MVKDGKLRKAKNRKHAKDVRHLKAALSSMPKPVHPKKGEPNGHAATVKHEVNGTPAVEVQFAQKLANNDPVMRNRAMKKLKKWIDARSGGEIPFGEAEMMRLWKGLYYCFWMSDKPLIQEELAESISSLVNSFGDNQSAALLFISSFMATMGREWIGIDRWRMDKFMMLVRRFLRHCFVFLARFQWVDETLSKWSDICEKKVISANSLLPKRKKKFPKGIDKPVQSLPVAQRIALGFQLHVVDVFLEELAKIGGEDLSSEAIQVLLKPFVAELARGDEERLSQHIEERIFQHLMRQSDLGIAYEEGLDEGDDEDLDEVVDDDDELGSDADAEEEEEMILDNGEKDPRAGKVDVVLPQLQPDYEKLAQALFEAGSSPQTGHHQRERLYRLTRQLRMLAKGSYPLAIDLSEDESAVTKLNVVKVAKKTAENELQSISQLREERLNFKKSMREQKKHAKTLAQQPVEEKIVSDESDSENGDLLEPVEEPTEAAEVSTPKKKNKKKNKKRVEDKTDDQGQIEMSKTVTTDSELIDNQTSSTTKKKKKKSPQASSTTDSTSPPKSKKTKSSTPESPLLLELNPEQKKKIEKKKLKQQSGGVSSANEESSVKSTTDSPSGLLLNISTGTKKDEKLQEGETVISVSKKKKKRRSIDADGFESPPKRSMTPQRRLIASEFLTNSLPSKTGLQKKKINFSLMENKCSSLHEIDKSISESPDIPFDADVKPKQGVLKKTHFAATPPTGDPKSLRQSVAYNTLINGRSSFLKKRSRASDFF